MRKFWNFTASADGNEAVLRLEGEIASESWWGDEVTPKLFMSELAEYAGKNITVWINSPGGCVVAGSQIYTALKEHNGTVTVKVDGLAASAASVIAMSGDFVYMSPPSLMMIHDPATIAWGTTDDMQAAINILNECKEAIINAYALKTGLSRAKIGRLMTDETWMNAKKAVELGFADKVLYAENTPDEQSTLAATGASCEAFLFGRRAVFNSLLSKLPKSEQTPEQNDDPPEPEQTDDGADTGASEITQYKNQFEIL